MWVTWHALVRGALRDRVSLFWSVAAPLALLFGLGSLLPEPDYRRRLVLGLMAFGAMGFALSGTGFEVMRQRTRGVYKLLRATPAPIPVFIAALAGARGLVTLLSALVMAGAGAALYGLHWTGWSVLMGLLVLFTGTACFIVMGFLLGNLGDNETQVAMYNNLFLLPQVLASEMFYSLAQAPQWVRLFSRLMPASHLLDALQAAASGSWSACWPALVVLLGMSAVFLLLAVLTFRWDNSEAILAFTSR